MTTVNAEMADCSEDYLIALRLEAEFALEDANADVASLIPPQFRKGSPLKQVNIIKRIYFQLEEMHPVLDRTTGFTSDPKIVPWYEFSGF